MFRHDVNMAINTPKMRTSFIEGAVSSLSNSSHIVETSQYVAEYITVSFNVVNVCLRMFIHMFSFKCCDEVLWLFIEAAICCCALR